jgi:hypothetical protein
VVKSARNLSRCTGDTVLRLRRRGLQSFSPPANRRRGGWAYARLRLSLYCWLTLCPGHAPRSRSFFAVVEGAAAESCLDAAADGCRRQQTFARFRRFVRCVGVVRPSAGRDGKQRCCFFRGMKRQTALFGCCCCRWFYGDGKHGENESALCCRRNHSCRRFI